MQEIRNKTYPGKQSWESKKSFHSLISWHSNVAILDFHNRSRGLMLCLPLRISWFESCFCVDQIGVLINRVDFAGGYWNSICSFLNYTMQKWGEVWFELDLKFDLKLNWKLVRHNFHNLVPYLSYTYLLTYRGIITSDYGTTGLQGK